MIIDLSDPAISSTYHQIVNGDAKDWLILAYTKARDALRLVDSGAGGPEMLRGHLAPYSSDVLFALVQAGGSSGLVLVCCIPAAVGGVKRARAIVHERALEDVFPARRAVLNISSEAELTSTALERVLHVNPLQSRQLVALSHPPMGFSRPMSPPRSSEEGRSGHGSPRPPPPPPAKSQERGLPLNLPEPLDPERQREVDRERQEETAREQRAKASRMLTPNGDSLAARAPSPKPGKPHLSVAVPPRGERGLQPMKYDGDDGEYDEDDNDNDEDNGENEDEGEDDNSPGQENLVLRTHSRPASRGPTPPPGPSILRHSTPIPLRPDLGTSVGSMPSGSHIRFTGPPKDHPHPDHHPLKPNDQLVPAAAPNKASVQTVQLSHAPTSSLGTAHLPADGSPALDTFMFQRTVDTPSKPEEVTRIPPASSSPLPPVVAPSLLHSSITWQSASQPSQSIPNPNTSSLLNSPQPPQSLRSTPDVMAPAIVATGLSTRPLPPQPTSTVSARSSASNAPGFAAHSRNASVSTAPGQTHVPSGTLSAFGRRPSVSSLQQNGGANPSPALLAQMNLASPTSLLERSSTNASAVTSSSTSTTAYRPMQIQAQGMSEAQLQVARSRAKWAAEEQGITVPPQPISNSSLPRSPPLTPPTSPPRSLSAEEAGRVRRDGAEKMRREAERRREEDGKKKSAEEKQKAEAELQLKLDKDREAREAMEKAQQEEKRKDAALKKRAMEEEQDKRRAEDKVKMQERFEQIRGTDEVFLTGHVNTQPESAMTWKWRFYELTASGRLSLYKSSDGPDRVKPLDTVIVKNVSRINRSADELELISFAFRLEFNGGEENWSFYSDSQHDMDVLTEGITWTMGS